MKFEAEFIVQKIGMSRTVNAPSFAVTLLKVSNAKVCKLDGENAIIAYPKGKNLNKTIEGNQKKYSLSKEFNTFASVRSVNTEVGDLDLSPIKDDARVQISFKTKGRGFTGVMKRWNFQGGPAAHGSRFHRRAGSIGNREWPGRVQKGKKMAGHYGDELVSVQANIVSFDKSSNIIAIKGSVPGFNGAYGRIRLFSSKIK